MKISLKKPTKRQVKHFIFYCLIILIGNAITAAGSAFFIVPNKFVMGGTTGLGIFVQNMLGGKNKWVVALTVYIANISLFIIGAILLGKKFAAATLAGTLLYPSFLSLFTMLNELYLNAHGGVPIANSEPLLAALMGSLLFGLGVGTVVRVGASTGGTDIPPLILHKYFNLPVSATLLVLDSAFVLIEFFVPGMQIENILYGALICIISSLVVDKVSLIGMKRAQIMIVSKKYREIRQMILNDLNRGVTMLYGKTGFLQDKCYVVMTVVSSRDVVRLKNEVQKIDAEAFLMVNMISEVRGRGFSSEKIALPRSEEQADLEDVTDKFEKGTE